jgi:hypothetical protein
VVSQGCEASVILTVQWVLAWGLLPYALAVAMPRWRWLFGCIVLIGGPLTVLWVQHWIVSARPDYNEGPGGAIGIGIFLVVTAAFTIGVSVRALTLALTSRGLALSKAFLLNAVGFALVVGLFILPQAWDLWRLRPAPQACVEKGFQVEIGGTRFAIPAAGLFTIYRGPSVRAGAYYLGYVASLRDLCGLTANGSTQLPATNLAIRFDRVHGVHRGTQSLCKPEGAGWAANLCAALDPISRGRIDETNYPLTAHVFAPGEVILGEFLGSPSSYRDSLAVSDPARNVRFITAEAYTPDGNPLTFACRPQSDGSYWCSAAYPWVNGTHLHYVFRSPLDQIASRGQRVDTVLREFVAQFRVPAGS